MIFKKTNQCERREIFDFFRRRRPHSSRHRVQIVTREIASELISMEVIPQCDFSACWIPQKLARFPVKAHDLRQEAIVSHAKQVAPARKKSAQSTAAVFKSSFPAGNAERHVTGLPDDTHLSKQANQIGVSPVVMHNETGVDRQNATTGFDLMGMGMTSEASLFFE